MPLGLDTGWRGVGDGIDAVLGSQAVLACLALGLACVFVLGGVPKLRKPDLAALAIVDFGLMRRSRRWAGTAVGAGECALALALAVSAASASTPVRALPAIAAAALLWFFVALLARALRAEAEFACFCFGGEESSVTAATVVRTGALAVAATVLAVGAFRPVAEPSLEGWVLALATAGSAVAVAALISRVPAILRVSG